MKTTDPNSRPSGFALVIALGLMAFILLLLVSLSTLVQVEVTSTSQVQSHVAARENAILAAKIALAELAKHAGPDQRITARADILADDIENPYWTGVWHSQSEVDGTVSPNKGTPHWLVSVSNPLTNTADPTKVAPQAVDIVNSGSSSQPPVKVERVAIEDQDNHLIGHYAWWIGDEGVKANVSILEPEGLRDADPITLENLERIGMAHRVGWQTLFGEDDSSPDNDLGPEMQSRILNRQHLDFLGEDYHQNRLQSFHDITAQSQSLLTNVAEGGLKLDLSRILESGFDASSEFAGNAQLFNDPAAPRWGLLRSFYSLPNDQPELSDLKATAAVRHHTDTQHGVHPIIGALQLNIGARASALPLNPDAAVLEYPLEVLIQPIVVLVNPYNVELAPTSYQVRIINEINAAGSNANTLVVAKLDQIPAGSGNPQNYTHFGHHLVGAMFGESDQRTILLSIASTGFKPGEAKIFTLSTHSPYPGAGNGGLQLDEGYNLTRFSWTRHPSGGTLSETEKYNERLQARWIFGTSTFELLQNNQLLQSIRDVIVTSIVADSPASNDDGSETQPTYFTLRLRSSAETLATDTISGTAPRDRDNGARWLADYNLRAPVNSADPDHLWGYPQHNSPYAGNMLYISNKPTHTISSPIFPLDPIQGSFWGADFYGADSNHREHYVTLFNVPRYPLLSIGSLQHANLAPYAWLPAYTVGNSWASPYYSSGDKDFLYRTNAALWDRFFFSTVEPGRTTLPDIQSDPLLNSRLIAAPMANPDQLTSWDQVAGNLVLKGGFNVNSTSLEAWKAVLRGVQGLAIAWWDPFSDELLPEQDNANSPFPRVLVPGGDSTQRWRGFRRLDDDAIDDLAHEIVERIRLRGPFLSMAQFVNRDPSAPAGSEANLRGLLQAAIDATDINASMATPSVNAITRDLPYKAAGTGPRSTGAPGFLTQGDLLQVLGPILTVRSDTFVIRAYGDTVNSLTGAVEATAWCEVVVQRVPQYTNEHQDSPDIWPPQDPQNIEFGRRFQVLSFRWLDSSEI